MIKTSKEIRPPEFPKKTAALAPSVFWVYIACSFLFFFFLSACISAATNTVNICLYYNNKPTSVIISPSEGGYEIRGDDKVIYQLEKKDAVALIAEDNFIYVKTLNKPLGKFSKIKVVRKQGLSSFKIKSIIPDSEERIYSDNLTISLLNKKLKIINHVNIESYISGVVESEAGTKQNLEYYKVQSIICRTFALNTLRKHAEEGFHLCDGTHCQVYYSKNRVNPEISRATEETRGLVIVDSDINIITAAFHSNCGGQTINVEDVWKYSLPYLKSVCDTFCTGQPHAYWEKKIPLSYWINYLDKKHNYPISDSIYLACVMNYIPPPERNPHILNTDFPLPLKEMRKDLDLRSTSFSISKIEDDSVLITGNGYGHGVGLCQEGAMKMSELGYEFDKILRYYYTNIHLVDLSLLDFFKD